VTDRIGNNLYLSRYSDQFIVSTASGQSIFVNASDLLDMRDWLLIHTSELIEQQNKESALARIDYEKRRYFI
jgi:hypothetical protein